MKFSKWADEKYPDKGTNIDYIAEYIKEKKLSAVLLLVDKNDKTPKKRGMINPVDIITLGFDAALSEEVTDILGVSLYMIQSSLAGAQEGDTIH